MSTDPTLKIQPRACVVCASPLTGKQRTFCSMRCKQQAKYEQMKGERCKYCKEPMKPVPMLGSMKQDCSRKACISRRVK